MSQAVEARHLRRGDRLMGDPIPGTDRHKFRTVGRTRERKSDRTINVFFIDDTEERFLWEDLVDVEKRDTLTFPTGPGATRYGR